ncbi:MAG: dTDP-4-dehydrorhamnose 3,5-epimerase [Desulfobacteraceae bacterium]|nr:MAG: dTDP-4-dehydrorhamnose 3,5-epimerase [Desulfobacteraceae bacterium]
MKFTPSRIPDVILIEPSVYGDERGFFMETWQAKKFAAAGLDFTFVQDNHSRSEQGTLRGLHYQIRQPQGKLVRVVAGTVFDVAVDLRRSSPTFGCWLGEYLSADNRLMLWVPPGFAHGFYVVSDYAEFLYKCTDFYAPEHERAIRWDDPQLAVTWPLVNGRPPSLSAKDAEAPSFGAVESFP